MKITIMTAPRRKQPAIGDVRTTKKHGVQVRVVETHRGMWVRSGSRYCYEWKTPAQLVGSCWEYLLRQIEQKGSV